MVLNMKKTSEWGAMLLPFLECITTEAGGAQAFPAEFQHRSALLLPLPVLGHWHPEQMTKVPIIERIRQGKLERNEEIKRQKRRNFSSWIYHNAALEVEVLD